MSKWFNLYLKICMLNNILMPILVSGIGPKVLLLPNFLDSVQTSSTIVVGLAEFGSVTAFMKTK